MLNDNFDRPQWHIAAGDLVGRTSTPLVWWHRLQEVLYRWEQLHGIENVFLEILWNISSELPNALENQFRDLGLLRIWARAIRREWFDNPKKQGE